MFRLAHPEYLWALLLLPMFFLLFFSSAMWKRKERKKLGTREMTRQMIKGYSTKRLVLKFWLLFAAPFLFVLLLCQPQFGTRAHKVEKTGVELMIAVDVSNSMKAEDVKPSRLDRATQILRKLIKNRENDKIGVVVFAGSSFLQIPLTNDLQMVNVVLQNLSPDMVAVQGTDIGSAIDMCAQSFSSNKEVGKSIILITDAEDNENKALEAVRKAEKSGIMINIVGIGNSKGVPIPKTPNSDQYMTDEYGNIVLTKFNESVALEIAKEGKGVYVHADQSNRAFQLLSQSLDSLQKENLGSFVYSEYEEQFPFIADILFILLLIEVLIGERKNSFFKNVFLFKRKENNRNEIL